MVFDVHSPINGHIKDMYSTKIRLHAQNIITVLSSMMDMIGGWGSYVTI